MHTERAPKSHKTPAPFLVTLLIAAGLFVGFFSLEGWTAAEGNNPDRTEHLSLYEPTPAERAALERNADHIEETVRELYRKEAAEKAKTVSEDAARTNKQTPSKPKAAQAPVTVVQTTGLPQCQEEDGSGQKACYWDADTQGNGKGEDVVNYDDGRVRFYPETERLERDGS